MMTIQIPSSSTDFCQPDESTFLVGFNRVRRYGTTQSQSSPATPCSYTIYQVQTDDTLERIALKHNCIISGSCQQIVVTQCIVHETVHTDTYIQLASSFIKSPTSFARIPTEKSAY
uniref:LysM domain-containing protein n=2 Tax=Caenorhabditis tropicalis TaxID=1561998 RepID=A0A1I7UEN3_9PELO